VARSRWAGEVEGRTTGFSRTVVMSGDLLGLWIRV
jgi:hypothetical protein